MPADRAALSLPERALTSLLALPQQAKRKLALHAVVALLLVNAWAFGFGLLSTLLLAGAVLVWLNAFLGPISRRQR